MERSRMCRPCWLAHCRRKAKCYLARRCIGQCVEGGCDKNAVQGSLRCKLHAERRKKLALAKVNALRFAAMAHYGGSRCNCPGCTQTIPGLLVLATAYPLSPGLPKKSAGGKSFYYWLRRYNYPAG